MSSLEDIKILLEAFDHGVINKAVEQILSTAKRTGATISGPIPLPTKIKKFTVIKGPHVDKDSREQFEMRHFKRLIIISPTAQTVDSLMKLNLSSGVSIKIATNVADK
jgi:small subunit ribosomal protein S10